MKPEDVPPLKLLELARAHERRFDKLLALAREGRRGINGGECHYYLHLWGALAERVNDAIVSRPQGASLDTQAALGIVLDQDEQGEVHDAIESGDYDELLGVEAPAT